MDKTEQKKALLEERAVLKRQLDYVTEKAIRAQYLKRIAALNEQIDRLADAHIIRADQEFNEALAALIAIMATRDGIRPTKSHAIRRAVIYTERMMRIEEQNDVK